MKLYSLLQFIACSLPVLVFARPAISPKQRRDADKVCFEVNLTWEDYNANGHVRKAILSNGQLPGPPLHLQQGDTVQFKVTNSLPWSTAIHFHGITQLGTPWADGVPGISQYAIPAGETYMYEWTADEYGTFFYHAHSRSQISDGLYGPIIIQPTDDTPSPFSLISESAADIQAMEAAIQNPLPVVISDWTAYTAQELLDIQYSSGLDLYCVDSILINGKGSHFCLSRPEIDELTSPVQELLLNGTGLGMTDKSCFPPVGVVVGNFTHDYSVVPPDLFDICNPSSGGEEVFTIDPNAGWASFNFIGVQSIQTTTISIDQHSMYIYAVDGRYIEPQKVDGVIVSNGNRYSAMVKLDQPIGDYTIRAAITGLVEFGCGYATISYQGTTHNSASTPSINCAGVNLTADYVTFNDAVVVPFPPDPPAQEADVTFFMHPAQFEAAWQFTLSGVSAFAPTLEDVTPFLFNPYSTSAQNPNNTIITKHGQWVDLILVSPPELAPPHPMHKHSNKFYVLGAGLGPFPGSNVAEAVQAAPELFNLQNPQLRDTYSTLPVTGPGGAWLALRYQVVNPGAFLFHCHIQTHFAGGLAMAILDGIDAWPTVPDAYLYGNGE